MIAAGTGRPFWSTTKTVRSYSWRWITGVPSLGLKDTVPGATSWPSHMTREISYVPRGSRYVADGSGLVTVPFGHNNRKPNGGWGKAFPVQSLNVLLKR